MGLLTGLPDAAMALGVRNRITVAVEVLITVLIVLAPGLFACER